MIPNKSKNSTIVAMIIKIGVAYTGPKSKAVIPKTQFTLRIKPANVVVINSRHVGRLVQHRIHPTHISNIQMTIDKIHAVQTMEKAGFCLQVEFPSPHPIELRNSIIIASIQITTEINPNVHAANTAVGSCGVLSSVIKGLGPSVEL